MTQFTKSIVNTEVFKAPRYGWYRLRMGGFMLFADVIGMTLAMMLGHLLAADSFNFLQLKPGEVEHFLVLGIMLLVFMTSRLYPGIGIDPVEEIKLVTQYASIALISGMMLKIFLHTDWPDTAPTMVYIWAFSILNVLLMRWSMRIAAAQAKLWGEPVAVLARKGQVGELASYFLRRRRLGYLPVLAATDTGTMPADQCPVPVVGLNHLTSAHSQYLLKDVETILIDSSFFGQDSPDNFYNRLSGTFRHIIFVSDMGWFDGASLAVRNFEGMLGIEARRNLPNPLASILKRLVDLVGSALGILVLTPLFTFIAVLIKLDSTGPVLYTQPRIGIDGKRIRIYKFRTMVVNAEQALEKVLQESENLRREWEQTQKLREDPRITRVGRFLRKFSLDEFPQLLNVMLGDMSLVGPRPILVEQVKVYGEAIHAYSAVRPGMTGLWQVSGRNHTTFRERSRFDLYYVRNWSIWLDIYILLRTVWVVLSQDGAY